MVSDFGVEHEDIYNVSCKKDLDREFQVIKWRISLYSILVFIAVVLFGLCVHFLWLKWTDIFSQEGFDNSIYLIK